MRFPEGKTELTTNSLNQYNRAFAAIAVAIGSAGIAAAQAPSTRHIAVTVTEPSARFVTSLERDDFEIIENGVRRAITRFAAPRSPISPAIVSREPLPKTDVPGDRESVANAVVELRNQYRLEFESETPSAKIQVVVRERPGLPRLKVNWR